MYSILTGSAALIKDMRSRGSISLPPHVTMNTYAILFRCQLSVSLARLYHYVKKLQCNYIFNPFLKTSKKLRHPFKDSVKEEKGPEDLLQILDMHQSPIAAYPICTYPLYTFPLLILSFISLFFLSALMQLSRHDEIPIIKR